METSAVLHQYQETQKIYTSINKILYLLLQNTSNMFAEVLHGQVPDFKRVIDKNGTTILIPANMELPDNPTKA